jgi:hypothetical protein
MLHTGILDHSIEFADYVDPRFADGSRTVTAWRYEPGQLRAADP